MTRRVLVPGIGRPYVDGDALDHTAPLAFTLDDVLSAEECGAMIAKIDELGPEAAPITTAAGFVMRPDVRNNERVIFDSVEIAGQLYDRIAASLPSLCGMQPVGAVYLNDDFEGGHTAFLDFGVTTAPRTGTALLFQHYMLHEGCNVVAGTKYVLRSDVMYR